jgi:hypothetical protein
MLKAAEERAGAGRNRRAICPNVVSSFAAEGSSLMHFSTVFTSLVESQKTRTPEKRDLTHIVFVGHRFDPGGWLHVVSNLRVAFFTIVSSVPHSCKETAQFSRRLQNQQVETGLQNQSLTRASKARRS